MVTVAMRSRSIQISASSFRRNWSVIIFSAAASAARNAAAFGLFAGLAFVGTAHSQSSERQGTWETKSPMPAARYDVVAAATNDRIYVLGGSTTENRRQARNEEYDPATDTWRPRAPLPSGANHVAAAVLNGKIYAIGGFTGRDHKGSLDQVFEYDPATDAWRRFAPLSTPRGSVGAAVLDGKIHAIGGRVTNDSDDWHTNGVVGTHEVYDAATGKWTQAAPLPRARDHMIVDAIDGKIHAIGGRFSHNDDMADLHDVYDPATGAWTSAPPLPTARGGISGTVYRGLVLVLGGEDEKRTYVENEAYDVKMRRWLKLAPMPGGRHGHGVAAIGQTVYVIGGASQRGGRGELAEVLAFTLR
jgi:N-acetylneuraminic acid mutarotase